jgi:hypothetical protein
MMGTSSKLFARQLTASQADVERAETLLNRDGLIPVEDRQGHRVHWSFGVGIADGPTRHENRC